MARKPSKPPSTDSALKSGVDALLRGSALLGKPWPEYSRPEGASPYAVAQTRATPDQVRRAEQIAGRLDADGCVKRYELTQNPIWLWMAISSSSSQATMPPKAFDYLKRTALGLFQAVIAQVSSFDPLHIEEGEEVEEGIERTPSDRPPPPDILNILELSYPGKSLVQAAARDLRAVSMAVASENCRRQGVNQIDTYRVLAIVGGFNSVDTGPSVGRIKQLVAHGQKLLSPSPIKP